MGVVFARFAEEDRILAIAKNSERNLVDEDAEADAAGETGVVPAADTDSVAQTDTDVVMEEGADE
jgi:DNA gyrase subunit A